MTTPVAIFLASLFASVLLTPWVRRIAQSLGVYDYPDGHRKCHPGRVPLWGGIAVYLAMVVGLLLAGFGLVRVGPEFRRLAAVVAVSAAFVCAIGCFDDYCRLRPRIKLFLQFGSILPVVLAGYQVGSVVLFGWTWDLAALSIPVTALWLVGCINAINLLDGMDGLASVVGVATAATLGLLAAYTGNGHVTAVAVALAGALAGFFVYNRPPATIFLGDSGSMVIGLVLGMLSIQATLKTSTTLSITAPLVVMTFPMFDTFLALVRRRLTGRSFDSADRQHIHHRLLDRGLSPWVVLATIGALCLATGIAATVATIVHRDLLAWITALTLVVLVVWLRLFGYYEWKLTTQALAQAWSAITRRWRPAALPSMPSAGLRVGRMPADQVWSSLIERAKAWGVSELRLTLGQTSQSAWQFQWREPFSTSDETGWALAVRIKGPKGWHCELRAEGEADGQSEFVSPDGLVRLLTAFASHFAERPDLVFDLIARESADQSAAEDRGIARTRAA